MSIQSPNPHYSDNEKRLIHLLANLLLDSQEPRTTNAVSGSSPLSDGEAYELAERIDAALESKDFWQTARLVEAISRHDREAAREAYLSGRARHGFSRIMSSAHYNSFLARLGFEQAVYRPFADAMEYEYFVRMERRLYLQLGIRTEVVDLLERFLWTNREQVEQSRQGRNSIEDNRLILALKAVRPEVDQRGNVVGGVWSSNRIAGALTLFVNMTVMFTTRDWSVTGTMSAMAGSIGLLAKG